MQLNCNRIKEIQAGSSNFLIVKKRIILNSLTYFVKLVNFNGRRDITCDLQMDKQVFKLFCYFTSALCVCRLRHDCRQAYNSFPSITADHLTINL